MIDWLIDHLGFPTMNERIIGARGKALVCNFLAREIGR